MTAITLRNIPPKLQEAIQRRAGKDGLSLNKTVIRMLEEAAGQRTPPAASFITTSITSREPGPRRKRQLSMKLSPSSDESIRSSGGEPIFLDTSAYSALKESCCQHRCMTRLWREERSEVPRRRSAEFGSLSPGEAP